MSVKTNKICALLKSYENQKIFSLIGDGCQSLCTTVVQVCATSAPNHDKWVHSEKGILCFVKDYNQKGFFFRLYCLFENCLLWEQPLYLNITYDASIVWFHIFEAENCIIGFNFAHSIEAGDFKKTVLRKISQRNEHQERKHGELRSNNQVQIPPQTLQDTSSATTTSLNKKPKIEETKNKNKTKISKSDISFPQNFQNIDKLEINRNFKELFKNADVNPSNFKESNEEINADQNCNNLNGKGGSTPPSRSVPRPPNTKYQRNVTDDDHNVAPTEKPSAAPGLPVYEPLQNFTPPPAPPTPPVEYVDAFPDSFTQEDQLKHVTEAKTTHSGPNNHGQLFDEIRKDVTLKPVNKPKANELVKPVTDNNVNLAPPIPQSQFNPNLPEEHHLENNDALFDSIQQGIELKQVTKAEKTDAELGGRGQFLDEIRRGIALKPVNRREVNKVTNSVHNNRNSFRSALSKTIDIIHKANHGDENEENDASTEDEEDWD